MDIGGVICNGGGDGAGIGGEGDDVGGLGLKGMVDRVGDEGAATERDEVLAGESLAASAG